MTNKSPWRTPNDDTYDPHLHGLDEQTPPPSQWGFAVAVGLALGSIIIGAALLLQVLVGWAG